MTNLCENCRKRGEKLMLKGDRCLSPKCAMVKKPYGPGAKGAKEDHRKKSEYGRQLAEKQKVRSIYGMRERQFRGCVVKAEKMAGNTAENLLKLLELRLDNVVYRLKLSQSRMHARQMVSHGLVRVNGKKVNIASYTLSEGDMIEPKTKDKYTELRPEGVPSWLELDGKKVVGTVNHLPIREEIDVPVNENMIIEFYSR